jgi:predicted Fe-Mo cluster-binding NifX family protein
MKRIAVPSEAEQVCAHFGHAPQFMMYEIDETKRTITNAAAVDAPPHQPGLLPVWLAEQGVDIVLAGGMGGRAQELLAQNGIKSVVGVTDMSAQEAVETYLQGDLDSGDNACDHTGCAH